MAAGAAPAEYRGAFNPIKTNVAGVEICEHFPLQAKMADKFAVVRSVTWQEPDHQRIEIFTGFPKRERRPSLGSYVSRLVRRHEPALPKFVSLSGDNQEIAEAEQPLWVGSQHRAFVPDSRGLKDLELMRPMDLSRLKNRQDLLTRFDTLPREMDASGEMVNPFGHGIQLRVLRAADPSLNCLSQQPKAQRQLLQNDLHPALCLSFCLSFCLSLYFSLCFALAKVAAGEVALVFVSE